MPPWKKNDLGIALSAESTVRDAKQLLAAYFDKQYAEFRAILSALGLAKNQ